MLRRPSFSWTGYAAAAVATGLAVAVRSLLDPMLGDQLPLVTLFGAVAFAGWYGGVGPGVAASLLGFALCSALFIEPRGAFRLSQPLGWIGLVAYSLSCAVIVGFARATEAGRRRTEEARKLLGLTLDSIGDGVITTDAKGRITSLNRVAEALTGWSSQEGVGRPLAEVFRVIGEQSRQPAADPARLVLEQSLVVGLANHTLLIARDGTERAIDDSAAPIREVGGEVSGVVLVFRDVSERRSAERAREASEQELADFFEEASVGIQWAAADGTILRVNRAQLTMLGYERGKYVGHHIADFHADRDVIDDILARLQARETVSGREARMWCKDGSIRPVSIDASAKWEDGRLVYMRCFTRDLSDRMRADEANSRLAAIVTWSDDAILSKDLDGIIQTWNRGAERLFGYMPDEVIGRPVTLLIPPERIAEEGAILDRIRRGLRVEPYETVRRRKDGSHVEISLTVSPVFDAAGRVIGASKTARDISLRKRVEAELRASRILTERGLQELQAIYENAPIGMCLLDRDLRYVRVNDRLAEMNGIPAAQHIGRTLREVVPLLAEQLEPRLRSILETGEPIVEVELTGETAARPGVRRTWLESWFPQRNGEGAVIGVNMVAQEVTDRKLAEEALREADRRKDEFLATLAHELRNPLAPIRNGLSVLARAGEDASIAGDARQMMERQLAHMVRLVDDLFDVSRISRGRFELRRERVELASIVSLAVETCRPMAHERSIGLAVKLPDVPVHLEADPVRLGQVLANLIGNACKFSDLGSEVRIVGTRAGGDVQLSVEDSGIGIEPELIDGVFEMFAQIDRSPERQGLGIGLALSKRLVELHGGRIAASSAGRGKGSQFVVTLPATEAPAGAVAQPSLHRPAQPRRILVVDDNPDSAISLALWLKLKGHETHTAYDGEEGLLAAERFRPEIVLLDIGLPKLDGYEVCRRIRGEVWGAGMRVIALTGWGQEDAKRKTAAAGFDAHLIKPVEHAALDEILSTPPP